MTPTTNNTKKVTRTVFDLMAFDDVKLSKTITLPTKPTTVEEALAAVGNDKEKLLDVIYEGLIGKVAEEAYADINGFVATDEDGTETPYTGKFADEEKGDLINKAVLSIAKMQGFDKSLPKEKKRELKEVAREFLRSNPAMLASIQK